MTTSTAPITLPAKHRADVPTWWVHTLLGLLAAFARHVGWNVAWIEYRKGLRHVIGLALIALLIAAAVVATLAVALGVL